MMVQDNEIDRPCVFEFDDGKLVDCGLLEDVMFERWHVDFEAVHYFVAVPRLEAYTG